MPHEITNTLFLEKRESFAFSQVSSRATDGDQLLALSLYLSLGSTDWGLTPITLPNKHAPTTTHPMSAVPLLILHEGFHEELHL